MKPDELVLRQQRLLLRSAQLRLTLADQLQAIKRPLAVADRAQTALQWLYCNPLWPLGALMLVLVLRPQRAVLWGGRLWLAWKTFERARNWMATLPLQRFLTRN